jgi:hypothetical protein
MIHHHQIRVVSVECLQNGGGLHSLNVTPLVPPLILTVNFSFLFFAFLCSFSFSSTSTFHFLFWIFFASILASLSSSLLPFYHLFLLFGFFCSLPVQSRNVEGTPAGKSDPQTISTNCKTANITFLRIVCLNSQSVNL